MRKVAPPAIKVAPSGVFEVMCCCDAGICARVVFRCSEKPMTRRWRPILDRNRMCHSARACAQTFPSHTPGVSSFGLLLKKIQRLKERLRFCQNPTGFRVADGFRAHSLGARWQSSTKKPVCGWISSRLRDFLKAVITPDVAGEELPFGIGL